MTDEFDDLLGVAAPDTGDDRKPQKMNVQDFFKPVTTSFLSQVMEMDPRTVSKKLTNLAPAEVTKGGRKLYRFRDAIAHLVDPVVETEQFIRNMRVKDLPQSLQKEVWDARLKEQTWRSRAGHLWHTDDVLTILGETFQTLRTTTQLWSDQIAEKYDLSSQVVEELTKSVDGLRAMLHDALVKIPLEKATRSYLATLDEDDQ